MSKETLEFLPTTYYNQINEESADMSPFQGRLENEMYLQVDSPFIPHDPEDPFNKLIKIK